jgi:hypothetical protein
MNTQERAGHLVAENGHITAELAALRATHNNWYAHLPTKLHMLHFLL